MTYLSQILESIAGDGASATVHVSADWGQGRATFGGLLAAIGNEVMRKLVAPERALRSLQTTFVGPATPGAWRIDAHVLRVGRAVTLARCDVIDGDQVAATLVGVYGLPRSSVVAVQPVALAATRKVEDINEVRYREGMGPAFMQHFAVRWAEGHKPFSSAPNAPTKAFIRHRDPAPLSESHVIALVDCIPTPAMAMFAAPAPSSSLVWTLEFFSHRFDFAPEAWWRIDSGIEAAKDGYVHQSAVLNDPDGQPAALSRQLFAVFG